MRGVADRSRWRVQPAKAVLYQRKVPLGLVKTITGVRSTSVVANVLNGIVPARLRVVRAVEQLLPDVPREQLWDEQALSEIAEREEREARRMARSL